MSVSVFLKFFITNINTDFCYKLVLRLCLCQSFLKNMSVKYCTYNVHVSIY